MVGLLLTYKHIELLLAVCLQTDEEGFPVDEDAKEEFEAIRQSATNELSTANKIFAENKKLCGCGKSWGSSSGCGVNRLFDYNYFTLKNIQSLGLSPATSSSLPMPHLLRWWIRENTS